MNRLYYQLPGTWFGDCMPFGKGREFFLFHQRDNRNPKPFGEPFGWDLSVTEDFVTYKDMGVAIPRGTDEEQDQFIFAGSVFAAEGRYHIFYTGYNRDYPDQGKASQVLMHAVSDDAVHWTKTNEAVTLPPQPGYDPDDWRDPFVMWNEEKQEYLLILGARLEGPKTCQTGRTVKFTSRDLKNWEFQGDFWAPNQYTMHEMPDLFRIGDWWYHIISEYSDKNKIVYRMARSIDGPWIQPADDAFDGRAYYAGRTFCLNGQRVLFGWVPTKVECNDRNNFEWAGTFMPHEIYQREDGTLGVKLPDTVWNFFDRAETVEDFVIDASYGNREKIIESHSGDLFRVEMDVVFSEETTGFGIRLYEKEEEQDSYQYHFYVADHKYVFEKSPNWPWPAMNNIGLERPVRLKAGEKYRIRIVVDDTIATLYVNGVALNVRMYERKGESIGVFGENGTVQVTNCTVAKG